MKLTDNTLKYLKEYGGLSFGERPFSHVDSLILCQLSYFKFQDLVPDLVEKMDGNDIRGVTMRSLRKHPKYDSLYVSDWYEKDNRRLYAAVARSRRFAKMRLNYYTNLTDKEMQMQFSAVTFLLEDGTVYVAFRGTDETIVGWREDFDMALKSPIPSQTAAKLYLRHIAEYTGDAPLMIGGHSKGGNEAVFAAMETEPQIQDRIRAVYCFDGPGFREDIYRKESYLRIEKKIIKMVPQDSFVGMLLHTAGSYQVVESSGKGVLQHDMFTWVVKEGDFVYKEEINPATEKKNQQINEWIASYSLEEQQEIVDALFEIIEATQADTVMDFTQNRLQKMMKMLNIFHGLEAKTKRNVRKLFHILLAPSERLGYTESSKKTAEPDSAVKMENKGVYKMELVTVREIYRDTEKYLNQKITVGGWLRSVRDSKTFGFLVLHDGTFFETLQIVYHDKMENFAQVSKLNVGAAVIVTGTLIPTPEAKQPFEIQADEVVVEGASAPDYPLQKKRHSFEYLRTISHLRPRTNAFQAVFRVRSLTAYAIHKFFQERDFVYVHTPLITGSDCEGAGEMFQVTTMDLNNIPKTEQGGVDFSQDFFGKQTNLTVSGQLNGETFAQAFRNIYTFGPTFRAENSNTTRHAAEFWMIEPEIAFSDLKDDMILAESMLKYVIRYVMENAPEEMQFFNNFVDKGLIDRLKHVVESEFAHVTYTEAIELLEKNNDKFEYKVSWGCDLQTEHERYLTEKIFKRPVFVTDYPKEIKAFYMKLNEDGKTVAAMDCLVPGIGEIIGGSQREDDYEKLLARMNELGLKEEDYGFYLDLRKYGSTRHAGFGLGFERCVMYLTGMSNIRDVIPFPRTVGNCEL